MPKQTASHRSTFEDLYNTLMEGIESELCTYNLGEIDAIYKGESKVERTERYGHYKRCLDLFWSALRELIDLTKADLKEFESEFFALLKQKIEKDESSGLSAIEESISKI